MSWTKEQVEEIKRLREEGYSSAYIAKKIGKSRNAVIGKLEREKRASVPACRRRCEPDGWSDFDLLRILEHGDDGTLPRLAGPGRTAFELSQKYDEVLSDLAESEAAA